MKSLLKHYYNNLNAQQRAAVESKDKHILLLAGPGSGKTTVILCRTVNLIENLNVNPSKILTLTFGKASSMDMGDRFKTMFGKRATYEVDFSTIHRFAYRVVRNYYSYSGTSFKLIEDDSQGISKAILLKEIYKRVNHEFINEDKLEELKNSIGLIKNRMIENDGLKGFTQAASIKTDNFIEIYNQYEEIKKSNGYIDFDDMLTLTCKIFKNYPEILSKCREAYDYIQVDEGQDVSLAQYEIIKMMAGDNINLFIVADDDQSIYGFRGSDPKALLNFKNHFCDGRILLMEQNYRSTSDIVTLSNEFIKTNKTRYNKNLFTQNNSLKPVEIAKVKDSAEQFKYIIDKIKTKKDFGKISVLFRNNISAVGIADSLIEKNIPFYLKDYKQPFFKHWVTQDITAFLNFALNQGDISSFERIYYKMNSYIPKKSIELIKNNSFGTVFDMLLKDCELEAYQIERIMTLKASFKSLSHLRPYNAINFIEENLSYGDYLLTSGTKSGYSMDNINLIIDNLKILALRTETIAQFLVRLDNIQSVMENSKSNKYKNAVNLSTIHGAKGLEYEEVYVIDLIDEQFPSAYSIEEAGRGKIGLLEEERRLFYVAMTRAKSSLHLLTMENAGGNFVMPSRFIFEVNQIMFPSETQDMPYSLRKQDLFYKGMTVKHVKFGIGKVSLVNQEEDRIEINFNLVGKKKLSIELCKKNKLIEPAR